jgi:uncharacterized protein
MENSSIESMGRLQRVALFFLILALSLFVFVVLSHFRPLLPKSADLITRICTAVVLLAAALIARRTERFARYWQIIFALFVGLLAISVDYKLVLGQRVGGLLQVNPDTPAGWAVDKIGGELTVVVIVIGLTLASGGSLASLRIKKGRLALGLVVGLVTFVAAAATAIPLAQFMFNGKDLTLARILPWAPWLLLFVLSNAFGEELLFRGLFLGKLEPLVGRLPASLLVALPFVFMHYGVPYTVQQLMFVAVLIPLAFCWGWLMQKTDGIWGSTLFHAGMDISIMLGMFSNLAGA